MQPRIMRWRDLARLVWWNVEARVRALMTWRSPAELEAYERELDRVFGAAKRPAATQKHPS